jgi:hypothetical protein
MLAGGENFYRLDAAARQPIQNARVQALFHEQIS